MSPKKKATVILVEDDSSVRRALRRLLISYGFDVRSFERTTAVLSDELPDSNACLVFDVHLPEMSGVDLFELLAASGCKLPVIFITGHVDEGTCAITERVNAAAVLIKPFGRDVLLDAIDKALAINERSDIAR